MEGELKFSKKHTLYVTTPLIARRENDQNDDDDDRENAKKNILHEKYIGMRAHVSAYMDTFNSFLF